MTHFIDYDNRVSLSIQKNFFFKLSNIIKLDESKLYEQKIYIKLKF